MEGLEGFGGQGRGCLNAPQAPQGVYGPKSIRQSSPEQVCAVGIGGALLMRPLLLHASPPSRVPGHRRVVHLDFASVQLPFGMRWFSERLSSVA